MTPARSLSVVAGGSVPFEEEEPRTWRTNWPVHIAVVLTSALGVVLSPGPATVLLALAWVAVYAAGHWSYVVRRLPGAGPATVVVSTALALILMGASSQGIHLFAAFPLIWLFLPTFRQGLVATLAAAAAMAAILIAQSTEPTTAEIAGLIAFGAGIALFSTFMAAWIWRIEILAHQRRELAEQLQATVNELEATRADLAASEHRRGVQEEGTRIAAEIHDTLAQSFTSITMLAQAARQTGGDPGAVLDRIEQQARTGLAEARGLIARTQPPLDLAASLRRLAEDQGSRTGASVTVDTSRWSPAPTRAEVVLLRTVQEALRNIERHAAAGSVVVRLAREGGRSVLEVTDDGCGFDPDLPSAGFGLVGMRSRLETEGGSLEIRSRRGSGTTLRARLPLTAPPAAGTGTAPSEESHAV